MALATLKTQFRQRMAFKTNTLLPSTDTRFVSGDGGRQAAQELA